MNSNQDNCYSEMHSLPFADSNEMQNQIEFPIIVSHHSAAGGSYPVFGRASYAPMCSQKIQTLEMPIESVASEPGPTTQNRGLKHEVGQEELLRLAVPPPGTNPSAKRKSSRKPRCIGREETTRFHIERMICCAGECKANADSVQALLDHLETEHGICRYPCFQSACNRSFSE